jgi:hypothetical protein
MRIELAGLRAPICIAIMVVATTAAHASDLPDPKLTPGMTDSRVTKDVLCGPGFTTYPLRDVSSAQRKAVFKAYSIDPSQPPCPCDIDHLIPLQIGGSNKPPNLWPEPVAGTVWSSRVKDRLEKRLHVEVCGGLTDLETAQREIAEDWIAAYIRRFGTRQP